MLPQFLELREFFLFSSNQLYCYQQLEIEEEFLSLLRNTHSIWNTLTNFTNNG